MNSAKEIRLQPVGKLLADEREKAFADGNFIPYKNAVWVEQLKKDRDSLSQSLRGLPVE